MTEYVAQFKTSRQISPDDWEVITPTMKVNAETKIGDILEWAKDIHREPHMREFRLIMLD